MIDVWCDCFWCVFVYDGFVVWYVVDLEYYFDYVF